jgi:hypothetical protein
VLEKLGSIKEKAAGAVTDHRLNTKAVWALSSMFVGKPGS